MMYRASSTSVRTFYITAVLLLLSVPTADTVPGDRTVCYNATNIGDARRSVDYTTAPPDVYICDYNYIDESRWYRFNSYLGGQLYTACVDVNHCGTVTPIWMNGEHPRDPYDQQAVQVCSPNSLADCCGSWSDTIQVMLCPAIGSDPAFYVYQLKIPPGCDMAYCAGTGQPCPANYVYNDVIGACSFDTPSMTSPRFSGPFIEMLPDIRYNNTPYKSFYFLCVIGYNQPTDDGARFDVVLTFDGAEDFSNLTRGHRTGVSQTMTIRFVPADFQYNLGKLASCKVRSYWSSPTIFKSNYYTSPNDFWIGVRYRTEFNTNYNVDLQRIEFPEDTTITLFFNSTVPLSCGAPPVPCRISIPFYDVNTDPAVNKCGIEITSADVMEYTLVVTAKKTPGVGSRSSAITFVKLAPWKTNSLQIWDLYQLAPIPVYIVDNKSTKFCSSVGDPHIATFDDYKNVDSYLPGDYLLFSSSSPRYIQVHTRRQYGLWGTNSVQCAVAVREGNNALGLFACGIIAAPTPIIYLEDPNVKAVMTSDVTGTVFTISMPSGTYVKVHLHLCNTPTTSYYIDIYVYPTIEDANISTGHCGNYNGNPADDFVAQYSTQYQLTPKESLINGNINKLTCVNFSAPIPNICNCKNTDNNTYQVDCDMTSNIGYPTQSIYNCYKQQPVVQVLLSPDNSPSYEDDIIIGPDDLPPVQDIGDIDVNKTWTWPTPSGITEQQATQMCQQPMLMAPTYTQCQNYVDISPTVEACVLDILYMDSTIPVIAVLDQFHENCVFQIVSSENTSSTDGNSSAAFIQTLLENVANQICPKMCGGHGDCVNGNCVCTPGFVGADCSIDEHTPPILSGFRKGPTCDARVKRCSVVSIYASGFYNSSELICNLTEHGVSAGKTYVSVPTLISFAELQCGLPPSPVAATFNAGEASAVMQWDVSVSNDGNLFSNSLLITTYDSLCINCSADGLNCQPKTTACLIDGQCFAEHETDPDNSCMSCIPNQSTTSWSYDAKCDVADITTTTTRTNSGATTTKTDSTGQIMTISTTPIQDAATAMHLINCKVIFAALATVFMLAQISSGFNWDFPETVIN